MSALRARRHRRIATGALALALVLALGGCTGLKSDFELLQEARAAYVEAHKEIAPETRRAILAGELRDGMTPAEVEASWGRPEEVNRLSGGRVEEWVFGCDYPHYCVDRDRQRRSDRVIHMSRAIFTNGRLTDWSQ